MNRVCAGVGCFVFACASLQAVEYEVTFEATWSQQTHPDAITTNAHFSPLIGATHNDQVSFWDSGALASPGIEQMAETGGRQLLQNEIEAAIGEGTAQHLILGSGTSSPGVTSTTFEVTESHSLVSLVTMVAPSPDWFVGIHDVDFRKDGQWIDALTVELDAYDAGTDSGPDFRSANADTNPPERISLLGAPFTGTPPLGTYEFRLASQPPINPDPPDPPDPPQEPQVPSIIALGILNDFEDDTTQGWTEGNPSPNKPTNVGKGGNPGSFLRNASAGEGTSGSRMVTYNRDQWVGNYLEAGVTQVNVDMINLSQSGDPLSMRFALQGPGSTRFGSTDARILPADGQWHSFSFGIMEDDLSRISGAASLSDVLSNVNEVRFVAAEASVAWIGDRINAVIGLDNIMSAAATLPADLDMDGTVNFADFLILSLTFGLTQNLPDPNGDIDGNGSVDFGDFLILSDSFGQSTPRGALSVPEPSTPVLMVLGLVAISLTRRQRCRRQNVWCRMGDIDIG